MPDMQQPPSPHDSPDSYTSASSALDDAEPPPNNGLLAIFEHFDQNKDGHISHEEMSTSLQRLGLSVPPEELTILMASADANADGVVNYEEFVGLYKTLAASTSSGNGAADSNGIAGGDDEGKTDEDEDLREAFEVFDKDGDGLISAKELHSVLKSMGVLRGRDLGDCIAMIRRVDSDGNGQVDFKEFKEMMASPGSMA